MLAMQLWFKTYSKTMIFILNPCHAVTFLLGLNSLLPFNKFTDVLYSFSLGSCFGAWIGIAFAENGELSQLELFMYYLQHIFACFLAPFVLYLGGRYSASDQLRWPLPYFGFLFFTIYMRYILTPFSAMTWANLNHSLCSVNNDPWKAYFGMKKYYYLWADVYLGLTSVVSQYFISLFGILLCRCRRFSIHEKNVEWRQAITGFLLTVGLASFAFYVLDYLVKNDETFIL
jgi:TMEM164 family